MYKDDDTHDTFRKSIATAGEAELNLGYQDHSQLFPGKNNSNHAYKSQGNEEESYMDLSSSDLSEALEICHSLNHAPCVNTAIKAARSHNFLPIWKTVSCKTLELADRALPYSPQCLSRTRLFQFGPSRGIGCQQRRIDAGRTAQWSGTAASPILSLRGGHSGPFAASSSPVNLAAQDSMRIPKRSGDSLRLASRCSTLLGGRRVAALPTALAEDEHWSAAPEWTDFVAARGYLRGPVNSNGKGGEY